MTTTSDPYDFAIIGAGIAGASAAFELAANGSVVLLEAEQQPGYHTTGRSAAFFSEAYGNAAVRALAVGSKGFLESPPEGFCEHPLLEPSGALYIGREDQDGVLKAHYEEVRDTAAGICLRDAAFALERVPVLRADYVHACIWEPDSRAIDVNELLQGFIRGMRRRGSKLQTRARVEGLAREAGVWEMRTTGGIYRARTVVNAAGAWADEIARMAGARPVGLSPKRRTACLFDPPPGMNIAGWPLVVDAEEQFYFKPDAGKILLSPADETPMEPCDVHPEDVDVAVAVDRLERATEMEVKHVDHQWAGLRSFVHDRVPVVGFDTRAEGFFWLAGQGGYGIMTSPAMARCVAALVCGEALPEYLRHLGLRAEDLSPARL